MCNHDVRTDLYQVKYYLSDGRELIVRVPEIKDAQALVDYMKKVDSETRFLAREPGEFGFSVEQEEVFIGKLLNDSNRQMLIAEIEGQVVANCSVGIAMTNRRFLHRAALGVIVKQEYWNFGIGRIMMNECIKWCRLNEIEQLELEVVCHNERALKLYKSLGFEIQGTKKNAMKYADGTYADEYNMILFF